MILFKMALRNIFKQKRRSFFTAVSMILGFVLLSVSIGFNEGGYGNVIKAFTSARTGHVQLHHREYLDKPGLYKNFEWNGKIEKALFSVESVKNVSPRLFSGALAFIDKKTTAVQIKGIVPELEAGLTKLDKKIGKGNYLKTGHNINEVLITNSLADILKAEIGSELILISQGADGSIANDKFVVGGILVKDLDSLENNTVFMALDTMQDYLALDTKVHEVAIITDDYKLSYEVSNETSKALFSAGIKDVSSEPWEVVEQQFYTSMLADKQGMILVYIIIILVVGIGVLNTVLMSILERTREYGVMKAMGTTPAFIFSSIVLETAILTVLSAIAGLLMSVLANWPMNVYGITYPEPVSVGGIFIDTIYSEYVAEAFYMPVFVILFSAVAASLIPAWKAAVAEPVKSMRSY
ncbi:ABC transporter permease [bacterium]|nr:ABC transporter permease [bacterium]